VSPLNLFAEYLVTRLEAASPWSAAYLPRELPFPHAGFGQDAEWVTANFTNATEILAVGYPQWVDAQVGERNWTLRGKTPKTVLILIGNCVIPPTFFASG